MKKVLLIDGNNLLFRAYYATAYSGSILKNSKGFPTNALYGFTSMINKIIEEEQPEYMMVAFDIGKNFRKSKYDFYKEGRNETPNELKMQMPLARKVLHAMGVPYLELEPYEADDIIGTVAALAEKDPEYYSLIVSSDKDLLQLISFETDIKLLKQSGFIRFNKDSFKLEYGIEPERIVDLKALMGDSSDNIPGVKGIGEKTALKLLQEYGSLDGIYENIDNIKGKLQEKLISDKENAYISYELATIYREVPINVEFESFKYNGPNIEELKDIYTELEFYSYLKNMSTQRKEVKHEYTVVNSLDELELNEEKYSFYLEVSNSNYHLGEILGMGISSKNENYFIKKELVIDALKLLKSKKLSTYDLKKSLVKTNMDINCDFDLMISSYLLNKEANGDISILMNMMGENITNYTELSKNNFNNLEEIITKKSRFIYDNIDNFYELMVNEKSDDIFYKIEMPLVKVLTDMENAGFKFENSKLDKMRSEVSDKINLLTNEIYELCGCTFNIGSPKQLGDVLFEKLEIGKGKKNSLGYKTDSKTLQKFIGVHPVIAKVLEYRNLAKLQGTYLNGLNDFVLSDGKIHTIFNQTLTRTGRLSSSEPNLQNIPTREEYGKMIRLAFVPSNDLIVSADYSQIELRILAHISESEELINAFVNGDDIHTKVAADINGIKESEVTKQMRSMAKAVIFGIVYGISGFGLGENLHIPAKDAKAFIEKYYELYPGVKNYMDNIVKSAYETGYVKTMFGRIRKIDELSSSNYMTRMMGERMALNTPIQGSSSDIMKMAMIKVSEELEKNNLESKLISQVHDEIIIDAKSEELDKVKEIIKDSMENIVKISVPLKIDINAGENWYTAK